MSNILLFRRYSGGAAVNPGAVVKYDRLIEIASKKEFLITACAVKGVDYDRARRISY